MDRKHRIELTDTLQSAIMKIAEGNPGALRVCLELVTEGPTIDPDAAFKGLGQILSLDTEGIYGSRIWMLYRDVCGEDLVKMVGVLRACQLGYLTTNGLHRAIDSRGEGIEIDALITRVRKRLPRFGSGSQKETQQQEQAANG